MPNADETSSSEGQALSIDVAPNWESLAGRVAEAAHLPELQGWLEGCLDRLEADYAAFQTRDSLARDLRRRR